MTDLIEPSPSRGAETRASANDASDRPPARDLPVFSFAAMSERLMGDEDLIRAVAEAFLGDMPEQIDQLKALVAAGDVDRAAAQAHKIKGAAANVGGVALSGLAGDMERAGKAGDMAAIVQGLAGLDHRFARLRAAMDEALS